MKSNEILCNCEICLFLKRTLESRNRLKQKKKKKKENEDINSCVYVLIHLSGHSPKTESNNYCLNQCSEGK